jgi:branched-chain amino acid aminotransferase
VKELVTPPLDGLILPGIFRDSVLCLARQAAETDKSLTVSERVITMDEVIEEASRGKVSFLF